MELATSGEVDLGSTAQVREPGTHPTHGRGRAQPHAAAPIPASGVRPEPREGYELEHVDACASILDEHLESVAAAAGPEEGRACVRETVLRLNELNARCGGELIETDQREDICAFVIRAGFLLGHNAEREDVTEQWREW